MPVWVRRKPSPCILWVRRWCHWSAGFLCLCSGIFLSERAVRLYLKISMNDLANSHDYDFFHFCAN